MNYMFEVVIVNKIKYSYKHLKQILLQLILFNIIPFKCSSNKKKC